MVRLTTCCFALGLFSGIASADAPKVGDTFVLATSEKMQWLYDEPAARDAAGRVIVYWFCNPKISTCPDDLARLVTLRDDNRVYIVAFIEGDAKGAKKLDPIRESEGVGRGTVGYGKLVTPLMKQLGMTPGPSSIVVDVDGKVAFVTTGAFPEQLDARDAKVKELSGAIKEFTTSKSGPATAKPGEQFALTLKIELASWLKFSAKSPMEFNVTVAKEVKCDNTTLKGEQLKIEGRTLTATINCSAPKGSYEALADIRFGYDSPRGAGMGTDSAKWKFEVKQ